MEALIRFMFEVCIAQGRSWDEKKLRSPWSCVLRAHYNYVTGITLDKIAQYNCTIQLLSIPLSNIPFLRTIDFYDDSPSTSWITGNFTNLRREVHKRTKLFWVLPKFWNRKALILVCSNLKSESLSYFQIKSKIQIDLLNSIFKIYELNNFATRGLPLCSKIVLR